MPSISPQDLVVTPDQLCIGLFVHIDLPWFSHPFSFNSFKIRSADQIKTLRELGLTHFRPNPPSKTRPPARHWPANANASPAWPSANARLWKWKRLS